MFSKEFLYINAIKYRSQLKVNFKKLSNNDIAETNTSTFIAKDEIMGRDIATKFVALQSEIDNTYISTLLLQEDVKLLRKNQQRPRDFITRSLNNDYNIAVSRNALFETRNYFSKCGVDYIFSAYHILNLHIEKTPCNNNFVVLLFNNQAFCVILNSNSEIVFDKRVDLTAFEDIKNSHFYENELMGQKLFDEIYALEVYELIKESIEEFYLISKNVFIEKISILYNLRLISEEQIAKMGDDFMINVSYHPISVDEELFELSKDSHIQKSFIKPRKKPNNRLKNALIISLIIVLLIAIAYLFYPKIQELMTPTKKVQNVVEVKKEKVIKKPVLLPNHIQSNSIVETRVIKAFESIPYDMVLKELTLDVNSMEMQLNLLNKDSYIKVLEPELKNLYENVDIEFKESKEAIKEATVKAVSLKDKGIIKTKDYKDIYTENEFMPIISVTEQMKILLPENSVVTFKNSSKEDVIIFSYLVNIVIQKPLEFFEIIDRLNRELYSINISYPINFAKTDAGIEVEFTVEFNQPK
ncbi:hypothetical protein CRV08_11325 [Halarcobacter ebronensis]|uniref:Uncharacterized protein n=1 Tax=Halarcobacter ebronensis TaxID=1462615 RepID=A0A4Q0YB54_9BACT|nr:hypothetical protein [Halarcobacter ebronensis]RXJ67175.1 hypothetical protein CRV08_11325 [Halarcobacter ebronensis]